MIKVNIEYTSGGSDAPPSYMAELLKPAIPAAPPVTPPPSEQSSTSAFKDAVRKAEDALGGPLRSIPVSTMDNEVTDFAMWLTTRPGLLQVGEQFTVYGMTEALEEWRKLQIDRRSKAVGEYSNDVLVAVALEKAEGAELEKAIERLSAASVARHIVAMRAVIKNLSAQLNAPTPTERTLTVQLDEAIKARNTAWRKLGSIGEIVNPPAAIVAPNAGQASKG